jgi:hypothetical protein
LIAARRIRRKRIERRPGLAGARPAPVVAAALRWPLRGRIEEIADHERVCDPAGHFIANAHSFASFELAGSRLGALEARLVALLPAPVTDAVERARLAQHMAVAPGQRPRR